MFLWTLFTDKGCSLESVLEPTLFCINTNIKLSHLLSEHQVTYNLFTDDIQFYLTLNNVMDTEHHLKRIMTIIKEWIDGKQLKSDILIVVKMKEIK